MKEFRYRITDPNGLHARPAGALTNLAKQFESDIRITVGEKSVDAKRLLSLMSLGAKAGTELRICIEGEDEERAIEAMRTHLLSHDLKLMPKETERT